MDTDDLKKVLQYVLAFLIGFIVCTFIGEPIERRAVVQTECHAKTMEMLHIVWENHPRIWKEIEQSQAFQEYDSIVGHDWEDFCFSWKR